MLRASIVVGVSALACAFLAVSEARAQQTSAIAGLVRDSSGAVLPGVTVEAASPVLIEKVRTVVTDDQGRYNIVDLRSGVYSVTFTLPGFNTLVRDGIELTSGFTAAVNAELPVGAVQETVTVSGAAPLVDTQNVRKQTLITSDLLDALPTSTKHWATIVQVTPGFSGSFADVAGQLNQNLGNSYHGKTGTKRQFDGMSIDHASGNVGYLVNSAMVEEISLQSSGISAESNADGSVVNMIPKEGSNTFSGSIAGLYTSDKFEASNLNDDLQSRGLTTVSKILKIYDTGVTAGGPIKRDKLWFFGSFRQWGNSHLMAGNFWNKTQGTPFYTPDLSRPASRTQWYESKAARVTWQAAQTHKFSFLADVADACLCRAIGALGSAPEAGLAFHFRPVGLYQGNWSAPITSKLLFEAGGSLTITHWPTFLNPGVQPNDISILELSNNFRYNASATYASKRATDRGAQRVSLSYITGSHAYKFGAQIEEAVSDVVTYVQGDVNYTFRNGSPTQITQYATPYRAIDRTRADMGVYFQDQWTIRRLTLNYGVRFDYFNGHVDANRLSAPASGWVPAREFGSVSGVPAWKDINPRVGAAYDLFGDGRTAVKVSIGRYVAKTGTAVAAANNPVTTSVNSITRTWNDANGDYVPDCDLNKPCCQWRMRADVRRQLRRAQRVDALERRCAPRVGRPELELGPCHGNPAGDRNRRVAHRWLLPQLVLELHRDRQPAAHAGGLRLLLHHSAAQSEPARRRRVPGLRNVRCLTREVHAGRQPGDAGVAVRPAAAGEQLLQRRHQRASGFGRIAGRRYRHRPDDDRQLLRHRCAGHRGSGAHIRADRDDRQRHLHGLAYDAADRYDH